MSIETMFQQAVCRIKTDLPTLKSEYRKAETWVRTLVVAVVSGGAADVTALIHSGHEILFTHAEVVRLEHTFLGGAIVSAIGLFSRSPLTPKPLHPQQ